MAAYSDDFNDAGLVGWTAIDGDWDNLGPGEIRRTTADSASTFPNIIRYDSELDTKDHFAQIDFTYAQGAFSFMGPCVNVAGTGKEAYLTRFRASGSNSTIEQFSGTTLTTFVDTGAGTGPTKTIKLERDGEFLRLYDGGVEIASYEIVGTPFDHKRAGLAAHSNLNNSSRGDNFSAEDLASGTTITGTLVAQETGSDTLSATGTVPVSGSLSTQETGADTFSATGSATAGVVGTMTAQEAGTDTFSSTGTVLIQGTFVTQETGVDSFASTGSVLVQGVFAAQEAGNDLFAASGVVPITGTMSVQETGSDTFSATSVAKVYNIAAINGVRLLV